MISYCGECGKAAEIKKARQNPDIPASRHLAYCTGCNSLYRTDMAGEPVPVKLDDGRPICFYPDDGDGGYRGMPKEVN